jgi:hypothetical protein
VDTSGVIDALPPISVEPPVLDLGFMAPRAGGKGTVVLKNTGDKPLTIAAVTPSCKCTTTSNLAGTILKPGESAPLEAALEGAAMPQTHRASIRVLVDGYAKVIEIQLRGETAMPVRAVPAIINAVENKPRQGRFIVESVDKKPFTVCAIGGRVPEFIGFNRPRLLGAGFPRVPRHRDRSRRLPHLRCLGPERAHHPEFRVPHEGLPRQRWPHRRRRQRGCLAGDGRSRRGDHCRGEPLA